MGGFDERRWKVVLVGVEDSLHIVLVRETEEKRQCLGTSDGRGTDRVDDLEEHFECVQRVVDGPTGD